MKALIYNGPKDVSISEVPDAKIERPTDVLMEITATNICGSDLNIYDGRNPIEPGQAIGHENRCEVTEVGDAAIKVKVRDRVSVPFKTGKPVGVICHGPWTLVEAGLDRGRTLTSYPSIRTDIRNAGGTVVDEEVVPDHGLVSSRDPDDLDGFCARIVEEFAEVEHEVAAAGATA